jgi:hypothetical protein
LTAGEKPFARQRTTRIEVSKSLSQARTRRRLWPTAVRMTLTASPSRPLRWQRAEVAVALHVADDGLDGRSAPELALNDTEDATLLTGDEDATRAFGCVVAGARFELATFRL